MEEKDSAFIIKKRIYYHDTDCGGVVYYANYLKYFEEARTEYFFQKNLSLDKLQKNEGLLFVVKRVEIDYKAPAYYLDVLEIFTKILKLKNVSIEFFQKIQRDDKILVEAKTILVCVNKNFKPTKIPDDIILRLNVL